MSRRRTLQIACPFITLAATIAMSQVARPYSQGSKQRVFEIRTYNTEPGKLPSLLTLMREHAVKLIENHGMTSVGYWVPMDKPHSEDTLIYIVAHDSRDAAAKNWAQFKADPEWPRTKKAAEANGKIFHKVQSIFAEPTDFSAITRSSLPGDNAAKQRVFEIRTYTTEPVKLPDLLKRFREHTTKLFEKHGMTNIGYWVPTDEPLSKNTLIYVLAHDSRDAAKKSWDGFRADPDWIKARDASEASGKIVSKVESVFAAPTDFSTIK